ncbi:MAG: Mur ligase family protein, partial [Aquihabitans sp.]
MLLSELLRAIADRPAFRDVRAVVDDDIELTRAVHDSREAVPGTLFCCVVGAVHDGHDHAVAAVAAGASALLCERPLGLGVAEIIVPSVREAMGPVAAALAGYPADVLEVIGVTGTNGKTTVVQMLAAILPETGVIGTLTGARTTPEAPELQALLAEMVASGRGRVAMEVSSHALDLHRVDGTRFRVAVFTNLSQDHLDHHGDMARYFQAKARLFQPELTERAVVNLDDPHGRLLRDAALVPTVGYSLDDITDLELRADGSSFRWRGTDITLHL